MRRIDREQVIAILRAHEAELRSAGVESVSLFGSVARGEPFPQDVDVAVRRQARSKKGFQDEIERDRAIVF